MVISGSGTHELLVLKMPGLPFEDRGGTDHLPWDFFLSPGADGELDR